MTNPASVTFLRYPLQLCGPRVQLDIVKTIHPGVDTYPNTPFKKPVSWLLFTHTDSRDAHLLIKILQSANSCFNFLDKKFHKLHFDNFCTECCTGNTLFPRNWLLKFTKVSYLRVIQRRQVGAGINVRSDQCGDQRHGWAGRRLLRRFGFRR